MPQTDRLISFAFTHQTLIIEGIFATILGIIVIWLFANLQDENETSAVPKDLESTLKKILEQTQNNLPQVPSGARPGATPPHFTQEGTLKTSTQVLPQSASVSAPKPQIITPPLSASVAAPAPGSAGSTATPTANPTPAPIILSSEGTSDVGRLKSDLESRNKKVDDLERTLAQAREDLKKYQSNAVNSTLADDLRKQIEVLEGRLREYAIIEDDLANLSIYKEENAKLKNELSSLKKGGKSIEEPIAPASESTSPAAPTKITNSAPPSADGPSWPINDGEAKTLIKEFDTIMGAQTPAAEIVDQANAKEGEKLIAEFQNFMKGTGA